MKGYTLADLPLKVQRTILSTYILENKEAYDAYIIQEKALEQVAKQEKEAPLDLFSQLEEKVALVERKEFKPKTKKSSIIWASGSYEHDPKSVVDRKEVARIVPRSEKAKEEQKKRTKDKAEVFTPSWVCCLQNNLIDEAILYENAFATVNVDTKTWGPNSNPIDFTNSDFSWETYISSTRLEITCGEGPYLMSRYDTTSGEHIPVRNDKGVFQRIGLLDRKFRVLDENSSSFSEEEWLDYAYSALASTYGYEWQGDNLILARLNYLNSFVDYYKDRYSKVPSMDKIEKAADYASKQIWQMDGLRMTVPMSCSSDCVSCAKKLFSGHDGELPVVWFGNQAIVFDNLLLKES